MLSAVIPSARGYPAVPLARQPVHQRCVHLGPLVLKAGPLRQPTNAADRDRTVSRRSEPSSRTLATARSLRPTFVPARHVRLAVKPPCALALAGRFPTALRGPSRASVTLWEATAPVKLPTWRCPGAGSRHRLGRWTPKGGISPSAPPTLTGGDPCLPPMLHMDVQPPAPSWSKGSRGLSV